MWDSFGERRWQFSATMHRVISYELIDVSEVHTASIITSKGFFSSQWESEISNFVCLRTRKPGMATRSGLACWRRPLFPSPQHSTSRLESSVATLQDEVLTDWARARPYSAVPGPKPLPLVGNTWRFLPLVGKNTQGLLCRLISLLSLKRIVSLLITICLSVCPLNNFRTN